MTELFRAKDNEFIAWYPSCVRAEERDDVWAKRRAAYYVHIPFCDAICDYCGFAVARSKGADVPRYLDALHREIDRYAELHRLDGFRFECGHFGGGTPSAIDAAALVAVKLAVEERFDVDPASEVTVEVNPISFTHDKAEAYAAAGVNRISFGVQSFDDATLRTIGRPHRERDVARTLQVLEQTGIENVSLDLIYGVPGQTLDGLASDLARAVDTGAKHLSCFRLEIIPFTKLRLREAAQLLPRRLPLALLNEMDDLVAETLTAAGYREYGAFNFARPGFESVHNEIAFMAPQAEYVGLGNSAYSFANGFVYTNHADIGEYVAALESGRDPIAFAHRLDAHEAMSRYFVLGVKFFRVSRLLFAERFGLEPEDVFGDVLARLVEGGMLERRPDEYVLTRRGVHFVNNVAKEFYVGDSRSTRQHVQFVPTLTVSEIELYARRAGIADGVRA